MKILMCNSFYYVRGGADRHFLELSEQLTSHGHEVIPFSMQDERNLPSAYSDYFLSHIDFPTAMRTPGVQPKLKAVARVVYSREAQTRIKRLIADTKPDIAHIHGIAHETSPSILPTIKAAGMPVVQTLHDYKLLCPNTNLAVQGQICERCKGHNYYNVIRYRCKRDSLAASMLAGVEMYTHKWMQIYEKNIDLFISPSKFLQAKVREYGIPNPVTHLPYFVDLENFQPVDEADNYFLYSGRLVGVKGVNTLMKAMRYVQSSQLYLAGGGELADSLQRYAQQENLTNVKFLGYLGTEALIPMIQRAAFLVVPSEWYENYPLTILEAFACGTPVIGANTGGIPEQVVDGVTGLLFEPGNVRDLAEKIQYLIDNPALALEMGRNARRQVEAQNDPEKHYQQLIQIYQELIVSRGTYAVNS